jgi:hypothetical protein
MVTETADAFSWVVLFRTLPLMVTFCAETALLKIAMSNNIAK